MELGNLLLGLKGQEQQANHTYVHKRYYQRRIGCYDTSEKARHSPAHAELHSYMYNYKDRYSTRWYVTQMLRKWVLMGVH